MLGLYFKACHIAGVDVKINYVLIGLAAYIGFTSGMMGLAWILMLLVSVLIHEFGHIVVARRFGSQCDLVTLGILGGMARIKGLPTGNKQELLVALAGPVVSLLLALVSFTISVPVAFLIERGLILELLSTFTIINLFVCAFNMIPAFPMDGGRVLRSLGTMATGNIVTGTKIAAVTATIFSIAFLVIAVMMKHVLLGFIAIIIPVAAWYEYKQLRRLHGLS